jgi:hypothetical protein
MTSQEEGWLPMFRYLLDPLLSLFRCSRCCTASVVMAHVVDVLQTFRKLVSDDIDGVLAALVENPLLDSLASYQTGLA